MVHCALICIGLLIGVAVLPSVMYGQETETGAGRQPLLLVKAHWGDTLASLAQSYLDDASKAWVIGDYNSISAVSKGQALIIPTTLFRRGGLMADGYQHVPVLAYHDIGEPSGENKTVSRSSFDVQMRYLKAKGFTTITPEELSAFLNFTGQLPTRAVLITFDTPSRRLYEVGIPILMDLGLSATIFVTTANVGDEGTMTWDQLKQLQQHGFVIGSQGQNGRSFTRRNKGQPFTDYFNAVEKELRLSKQEIKDHLGKPCRFLAYPEGSTNPLVVAMAAKVGFSAAFTLSPGENPFYTNRYVIHRAAIDNRVQLEQFGKLLITMIKADLN